MKITLTMNEVIALVRNQYRFHDDDNIQIQIEIEGFGEVDAVSTVSTVSTDTDGWISVPADWSKPYPPSTVNGCYKLEVSLRDGTLFQGPPDNWIAFWVQENDQYDIVKFRKIA